MYKIVVIVIIIMLIVIIMLRTKLVSYYAWIALYKAILKVLVLIIERYVHNNNNNNIKESKSLKSKRYFISVNTSAILIILDIRTAIELD